MGESRVGTLGGVEIRLAGHLPHRDRYTRRYVPVDPDGGSVVGDRPGITADDQIKSWLQSSWVGGEGQWQWDRESRRYWRGQNVRPRKDGTGLILGPHRLVSRQDNDADDNSDAEFTVASNGVFSLSLGAWSPLSRPSVTWVDSTNINNFDLDIDSFGGFGSDIALPAGPSGNEPASVVPFDESLYVGVWPSWGTGIISKFDTGGLSESHTLTNFDDAKIIGWVGGAFLIRLDDKLYEITGWDASSDEILRDETPNMTVARRLGVATDVGAAWVIYSRNGEAYIREYNVGEDVAATTGQIPGRGYAIDMMFAHGFIFVLWQPLGSDAPFIYYQAGGQRGFAGPLRFADGGYEWTTLGNPDTPLFVGVDGADILIYWDEMLWSYNVSAGALHAWASQSGLNRSSNDDLDRAFLLSNRAMVQGATRVELYALDSYTTETGYVEHSATDFDYPGTPKTLLDVTVITDPLPAGTSVSAKVSVDGDTYVALSGTHSTTGDTKHTFAASTSTTSLVGDIFQIRLELDTTDTAETPVLRQVSARATGAAHTLEWVLAVDTGAVGSQAPHAILDDLRALVENRAVVSFVDPWQNRTEDGGDTFDVTVEDLILPELWDAEAEEPLVAQVRLRARAMQ